MNLGILDLQTRLLRGIEAPWTRTMQGTIERITKPIARPIYKRPQLDTNNRLASNYFSLQSFYILLCLTTSLLVLPLVLPPLPPPPFMLLLLPVGIFVLLLFLAFMPSDVGDIASSYL